MASALAFLSLLVVACAVVGIESRAVRLPHSIPVQVIYDSPETIRTRSKRQTYQMAYPQRTLMFTGFYRPARQSASNAQAGGVYAQGNAVGGGAFFQQHPPTRRLPDGPRPVDEPELVLSNAEAAPELSTGDTELEQQPQLHDTTAPEQPQNNFGPKSDDKPIAEEHPASTEQPRPSRKGTIPKKGKKIPIPPPPSEDEDEADDYEDEEELDAPANGDGPFRPPGRRPRPYPSLNNFFPVVFSFRGVGAGRRGSVGPEAVPGLVTAIANSYSTSKGGVASSVATAYGGSPTKKQRRTSTAN